MRTFSVWRRLSVAAGMCVVWLAMPATSEAQPGSSYCSDICTISTSCSTSCISPGFEPMSCAQYGICNEIPTGGGGGCTQTCSVYSKCDQQCIGGQPNPYNHTCSEYTECGWCRPATTENMNWWNPDGNCAEVVYNSYGDTCVSTGWTPGNPPYCSYDCYLPACYNLR